MKLKEINTHVLAAAVILVIGVIIACTMFATNHKSDYITVTGQSEFVVLPDQAVVYFSINTDAPTAKDAQIQDAAVTKTVSDALAAQGAIAKKIETSNYNLGPKTEWTSDGPVDNGYTINHQFKVTAGNVQDVGKIIEVAVGAGANGIDNINYEMSPAGKSAASAEAMRLATVAAHDKAQKVASSLGLKAGRTLKIEEGSWWFQEPSAGAEVPAIPGVSEAGFTPRALAIIANVNAVFEVS